MAEIRLTQIAVCTVDGFSTVFGVSTEGVAYYYSILDHAWKRMSMQVDEAEEPQEEPQTREVTDDLPF